MPIGRRDCRQGTTASGNTCPCAAFSPNPQNGDSIYVWMSSFITGGVTHQAPTDNVAGSPNTYTQIGTTQVLASGNVGLSLWLASNITGGASFVVTGHVSAVGTTITVIATCLDSRVAYNGDTAANTGTSTTPATPPSSPAPAANSYFTTGLTKGATNIPTAGSGWQFFTNSTETDNVTFQDLYVEESVSLSSSAMTGTFGTLGSAENWVARVASFGPVAPATLEQYGYRARNDDGSEATATWKAAQNTTFTLTPDQAFRLRFGINAGGDPASANYKLQYRKVGAASWRSVDTAG